MGDFGVCPDYNWLNAEKFWLQFSVHTRSGKRAFELFVTKFLTRDFQSFLMESLPYRDGQLSFGKAHITYVGPLSWIKKYLNHKDVQTSKVVIAFISAYRFLTFVKFQTKIISFWVVIKFPWPKFLFNTWLCKSGFFCRTKQFHLNQIPDISSLFRYRRHRGLAFRGETLVMSSEHSINTSFLHNFFILATYLRQGNVPDIT